SASGTPITLVQMSGMYPANVAYNMSVDGNFTEDMTLIGNHRAWTSTGPYVFSGVFYGDDTPLALTSGWGGVQRRENFSWDYTTNDLDANGQVNETAKFGGTVLRLDIAGISSSGTSNQINGGTEYRCSVQSVN